MIGIYDDGAAYGPHPDAQPPQDVPADPIYDDGARYGPSRAVRTVTTPDELRARAGELENRVPPMTAGPRTDDERMWLEKAAALRAEADSLDTTEH